MGRCAPRDVMARDVAALAVLVRCGAGRRGGAGRGAALPVWRRWPWRCSLVLADVVALAVVLRSWCGGAGRGGAVWCWPTWWRWPWRCAPGVAALAGWIGGATVCGPFRRTFPAAFHSRDRSGQVAAWIAERWRKAAAARRRAALDDCATRTRGNHAFFCALLKRRISPLFCAIWSKNVLQSAVFCELCCKYGR
mgnify:CR=1 FL=1